MNTSFRTPETYEMVYLDTDKIRFGYDGENLTFLDSDGTVYPRVTLRRAFPLSAENTFILVRIPDNDEEIGRELGMISDVEELEPKSKEAVLRELRLHYFVPIIQRILSIRDEFGFLYWSVQTDRGEIEFIMRDSVINSVRQVSAGRWLIIDINQTRFEIHDFDALDAHSQKLLRRYLLL